MVYHFWLRVWQHFAPCSASGNIPRDAMTLQLTGISNFFTYTHKVAKILYHYAEMIATIVPICRNEQKWCTNVLGRNLSPMYLCAGSEKTCTNMMASKISVYQSDSFVMYQCEEKSIFFQMYLCASAPREVFVSRHSVRSEGEICTFTPCLLHTHLLFPSPSMAKKPKLEKELFLSSKNYLALGDLTGQPFQNTTCKRRAVSSILVTFCVKSHDGTFSFVCFRLLEPTPDVSSTLTPLETPFSFSFLP